VTAVALSLNITMMDKILLPDCMQVENLLRNPYLCTYGSGEFSFLHTLSEAEEGLVESLRALITKDLVRYHHCLMAKFPNGVLLGGYVFGKNLDSDDVYLMEVYKAR
jgi:hypothetical protein